MNHYSDHYRRNFMDDRVYRSAPLNGHGLNGMFVDQRAPRYSPGTLYDDRQRTSYFDEGVEHRRNGRSGSPYARAFRGYDDVDSYMGNDELVRRINRQAAMANRGVSRFSSQLYPKMTHDGRYPPSFNNPRRFQDLACMDPDELERIMMAYELGERRRRYYQGSLSDRFDDDDVYGQLNEKRRRDLIAIAEFLGAYQLSEQLGRW
ncbi:hypothetical protein LTR10_006355 [Elasticomyces elasticus]|nr:hypothetical protein LTR10_006355 [Elasticomyces elasticus]